jgi:hypothetical protein
MTICIDLKENEQHGWQCQLLDPQAQPGWNAEIIPLPGGVSLGFALTGEI